MNSDVNVSIWREMETRVSRFGSASKAKELRHKYMNSKLTDEEFEKIWAIILASLREELDKIWVKHELDPNEVRKEVSRERVWKPKAPRANAPVARKKTKGLKFTDLSEDINE